MTNYVTAIGPVANFNNIAREGVPSNNIAHGFMVQAHEGMTGNPSYNSYVRLRNENHKTTVVLGSKGLADLPESIRSKLTEEQRTNFVGASFADDGGAFAILTANGRDISVTRSEGGSRADAHNRILQRYMPELHRAPAPAPDAKGPASAAPPFRF